MAVDTRQVSAASDTVVYRKIHRKSECVTTVVPKLTVAPQGAYEFVQPRPRDYGYTDSLPPGSGCLDSPRINTPEAAVSSMEVAGGSPPAEINISRYRHLRGSGCAADSDVREDSNVRQVDGD